MPSPRKAAALTSVALAVVALAACGTTDDEGENLDQATEEARSTPEEPQADAPLSGSEERGRELFVQSCGSCHTLEAAGTQGAIGPNLDDLQADQAHWH